MVLSPSPELKPTTKQELRPLLPPPNTTCTRQDYMPSYRFSAPPRVCPSVTGSYPLHPTPPTPHSLFHLCLHCSILDSFADGVKSWFPLCSGAGEGGLYYSGNRNNPAGNLILVHNRTTFSHKHANLALATA